MLGQDSIMFDKSTERFPNKKDTIFLAHCSISPLYCRAMDAMHEFSCDMSKAGVAALPKYFELLPRFHRNAAELLKTSAKNISYVHNTAEAMSMVANGYPFSPGDQIISYVHEYPSNHYPWKLQRRRGVELILLEDFAPHEGYEKGDKPKGWSLNDLEGKVTERTRVVAISHVQFSSGFAADLLELGSFCREKNIDLVVDCAQSLGCLPVYPEEYNISAIAASAWKWLMGPWGSGVLYTSEEFRSKLTLTMGGPDQMVQGLDYLDLRWNPRDDGRCFEYSTLPWDHIAAMNVLLEDLFLKYRIEEIRDETFRLQDLLLEHLDQTHLRILHSPRQNRSGILAAEPTGDYKKIVEVLLREKVVISAPIGYLRFAPHYYNDDSQIRLAAERINNALSRI